MKPMCSYRIVFLAHDLNEVEYTTGDFQEPRLRITILEVGRSKYKFAYISNVPESLTLMNEFT
jgi:hypothetical protein